MKIELGAEFQDVIICSNGVKIVLIGQIVALDLERKIAEVQYRYPNGNLGGLAGKHFSLLPQGESHILTEDWRGKKAIDYGESVTLESALAGDNDESVTLDGCAICGKPKSPRAKTCSPKCRKALSRSLQAES